MGRLSEVPGTFEGMGKRETHIIWDWNGTLFHDIDAVIAATNAAFAEIGLDPITLERYRELYCVPIPHFYERLMGRLPTPEEWAQMDVAFQRQYAVRRAACQLAAGAEALLERWQTTGRTQSLLSLYEHDNLVPLVRRFGIESRFVRVQGRTGPSGGGKAEDMVRHLAQLDGVRAGRTVVIGDALDDALAARQAGAHAVLYSGGSHSRASLAAAGVPIADTLAEAIELAEVLTA